jgi:uncharacterized protein YbjT (DUF2867 family)
VDEAALSEAMRWLVHLSLPAAAILLPVAFFLSVVSPDATTPNALIYLAYVGAVSLAAGPRGSWSWESADPGAPGLRWTRAVGRLVATTNCGITDIASPREEARQKGGDHRISTSEFLITGGTGSLGRRVADRLRGAGRDVRVLSRSEHPDAVRGDLSTGEGLERAVDGVDVIVHCASSPRKTRQTDVEGTERLLRAAGQAGISHLVFISIVGIDRNPYFPYYRMKLEVERTIERSPVPWTILRATQFHEFVLRMIQFLERLPVVMVPKGSLQPMDAGEVADRLGELALSEPVGRAPDIGGPEIRSAAGLAREYLEVAGRGRRVVEVPFLPGKTARAFREGAQVCPEGRYGRIRWEEFLRRTIHPTKD